MNSASGNDFLVPRWILAVCGVALVVLLATVSFAAEPAGDEINPTETLAVEWLPEAYPVVGSDAKDEAEMRKYTERIVGTELKFDMAPIPGGKFKIGSPEDEEGREDNEGPQVEVCIEPFWMGTHEVTWDEYDTWSFKLDIQRRKMKREDPTKWDGIADVVARPTAPYSDMTFEMGHDGFPAICMTQYGAKMYCKWLCAKTGRYYRLPTEAEWEHACRAGTTTAYSFGDDPGDLDDYATHFDNCPDGYDKIGQKKPNPWGLYDMHGNVAEWTLDRLTDDYKHLAKEPFAVPTKLFPRVVRGGHWDADPEGLRSAARLGSEEDWKMQDPQIPQSIWYHTDATFVGFRVVRPLRQPTAEEAKLYEPDPAIIKEYREAQGGKE